MTDRHFSALLIEDNPRDVRLIQDMLSEIRDYHFELESAHLLSEGVARLAKSKVDVILLDLMLPDSQGLDTFNQVSEKEPGTPILILTGQNDEAVALNAVKGGAQDYLMKGHLDGNLLTRAMRYAIERQRTLLKLEQARKFEHHLAYHDYLTNLPNRQLSYDRLGQAMAHARRNGRMVAILFLDLDGFKTINDTLGHMTGDHTLQAAADRLRNAVRASDTVARLSGDEFAVILGDMAQPEDAAKVAQKVLDFMARPFRVDGHEMSLTTSIGISLYPTDASDIEMLFKNADTAMYRAKSMGKNRYQLHNVSMDASNQERLSLEKSLRQALEKGELELHYQPQVNIHSGEMTGVEALVRWQHPEQGLVSPARFIPLAEETGLILPLGEWVVRAACQQNKAWQDSGMPAMRVTVNLSARQFRERELLNTVASALEESRLDPSCLGLEITETNAMHDVDYTIETLQGLKDMGIQIAVDDFGTGYSSLSYLKRFPIDMLKIDRTFVQGIPNDRSNAAITTAIIALAHSLQLKVIAEGVEARSQLAFLRSLRCDEFQGFLLSRPLPAGVLADLVLNQEYNGSLLESMSDENDFDPEN